MSDLDDLLGQRAALDKQIADAVSAKKAEAREGVARLIANYGFTFADLYGKAKTGKKVAVKFKHPDDGRTWTGRGKAPRWVEELRSAGREPVKL